MNTSLVPGIGGEGVNGAVPGVPEHHGHVHVQLFHVVSVKLLALQVSKVTVHKWV